MSAEAILSRLSALGVGVRANGDRLRLESREELPAALLDEIRAHKPELLAALRAAAEVGLRTALHRLWALGALGAAADASEVGEAVSEAYRAVARVPDPTATTLVRGWAAEWHRETGVCPWCGEAGPYHDPARGEG